MVRRFVVDLRLSMKHMLTGKGRGRQVLAAAMTCNVILIVLDALKPMTHKLIIEVCSLAVDFGTFLH